MVVLFTPYCTSWSILQIPLKLIWAVLKLSVVSLTKLRGSAVQAVTDPQTTHKLVPQGGSQKSKV
jgi:hypothetical protein